MRPHLFILYTAISLCFALPSASNAEELTGTLKRIYDSGEVRIGIQEDAIPFSYWGMGYSYDYAAAIVDAIKVKIGKPNLKVTHVDISFSNRFSYLQENRYDFECSSSTNTKARQQDVSFSNTIFIAGTRILVRKDSGIRDFADLKNKAVSVSKNTTAVPILKAMNKKEGMNITILEGEGTLIPFEALHSGKADAFFADDVLLLGSRVNAINPRDWIITGTPQSYEAYACVMQKGDTQLKQLVDQVISDIQTSGKGYDLYEKWFIDPIPPKGTVVNYPLSDAMKGLFERPNDRYEP